MQMQRQEGFSWWTHNIRLLKLMIWARVPSCPGPFQMQLLPPYSPKVCSAGLRQHLSLAQKTGPSSLAAYTVNRACYESLLLNGYNGNYGCSIL
ncbi:hypothetical protein CEXT_122081 [Caerostris extrusa]|uniref:Uncharacterized protein n=1 Tax=Caerostris extrusa TaxID=172846 RepID=A0AAV4R4T4_CAEEX|nr:hypothetical protein CEXT_122081 [Caerostris extrusa]